MRVRNINKNDNIDEIAKVFNDSYLNAYRAYLDQEILELMMRVNWREVTEDFRNFFLLIDKDQVIGIASLKDNVIERIYLRFDYVDQGLGSLLLNAMAIELEERGYEEAVLWDIADNARARRFLEKNDFEVAEDKRLLPYGKTDVYEFKYVLNLKSRNT